MWNISLYGEYLINTRKIISDYVVWIDLKQYIILRGPFAKFTDSPYLLRVETLWRCGDGLLFEVPSLASDALLTTLCPLLENVLQTVDHFVISCLGAPFPWLEKPRNRNRQDLNWILWSGGTPSEHPPYSPDLAPMLFLGISNHEMGAPRQEISKWSTICSMFSRSGWSVVRSAQLAKAGISKKRPSLHLHKVPTRSNKVSPWTLQTAVVYLSSKWF
jgi:hypothetical protein